MTTGKCSMTNASNSSRLLKTLRTLADTMLRLSMAAVGAFLQFTPKETLCSVLQEGSTGNVGTSSGPENPG
ncbi:unnamed protein product [Echinostoma caproni]|uniref:Secreted protein n=1 Tax=Echinostoma caproni TaxID=27848 RepID=A0A183A087_9TREM|nr:unnamed protein product [Echinostoma caproni]